MAVFVAFDELIKEILMLYDDGLTDEQRLAIRCEIFPENRFFFEKSGKEAACDEQNGDNGSCAEGAGGR